MVFKREEWASENGIDVIYKGPTDTDAAAQVQIMTDLVNQGVDVLCFSPNDPDACEEICKEAMEKGIIVIATEASGMQNVNYDIEAFDEAGLGGFLMDQLAAQMGEEGEYITMVGSQELGLTAKEALSKIGYQIDLDAKMGTLSVADKQLVAICRAMAAMDTPARLATSLMVAMKNLLGKD